MRIFKKNPDQEYFLFIKFLVAAGVLLAVAIYLFISSGDYLILNDAWRIIKGSWWFVLPFPVWVIYDRAWGEYRWTTFRTAKSYDYVWLQIIPPPGIEKSPKSMESIFTGLHTWSKPNFFENYCGWRVGQDRFSFDIVGDGENGVRFFFKCPKMGQNLFESLIYAQYPEAEVRVAEDFTKDAPKNIPNKDWDVWGTVLAQVKEDCIPIRTHREFKDDITGDAIDPLASLVEVMGRLSKDERLWYQIIFSPKNEPDWVPQANAKMKKIIEKFINDSGADLEGGFNVNKLPPGEQDVVKAIKNSLARVAFKSTLRFVYLGKRTVFNKATGVGGFMGSIKQFNDNNLNSFMPDNRTKTFANYHFQLARLQYRQRKIVNDYRGIDRAGLSYILTAEELATLYHFPTMTVTSASLNRVQAKKSQAPSNLPME